MQFHEIREEKSGTYGIHGLKIGIVFNNVETLSTEKQLKIIKLFVISRHILKGCAANDSSHRLCREIMRPFIFVSGTKKDLGDKSNAMLSNNNVARTVSQQCSENQ